MPGGSLDSVLFDVSFMEGGRASKEIRDRPKQKPRPKPGLLFWSVPNFFLERYCCRS